MQIKYHTKKGSIYSHIFEGGEDYWIKKDTTGDAHPLVGGLHISKKQLQELVREYPSSLLDKTYCFDIGVEKEFFEDARREPTSIVLEDEESVILFMIKRDSDRYGLGCSSRVVKIERIE